MIVYHGSTEIVKRPDIKHSQRHLDFGKGFYVTSNIEQAEKWARRKALLEEKDVCYVNTYTLNDFGTFNVKRFDLNLSEWLDFVCECRDGSEIYKTYDVIIGKVADDKVFRVVDFYKRGIWDKDKALSEIRVYPTYDQIAFVSQKALDSILFFDKAVEVTNG